MSVDVRVELDTRDLDAGIRQLVTGIEANTPSAAMQAARIVAAKLRDRVPVRTGTLLRTIQEKQIANGAEVHYGGELPYAGYIDTRTSLVSGSTEGADSLYRRLATEMASKEVRRL